MTKKQIKLAAISVAGIAEVSDTPVDYILELLAGNIFSDEECSKIQECFDSL